MSLGIWGFVGGDVMFCRPFFIGDYVAGVEAFVDEYWLVIHRAAGWGALRAWLMASRSDFQLAEVLISSRSWFLDGFLRTLSL